MLSNESNESNESNDFHGEFSNVCMKVTKATTDRHYRSALQVGTTALQVGDYRSALHIGIARSALQLYRSASPGQYRHEVGTIR